jgi:hypothetical protein
MAATYREGQCAYIIRIDSDYRPFSIDFFAKAQYTSPKGYFMEWDTRNAVQLQELFSGIGFEDHQPVID